MIGCSLMHIFCCGIPLFATIIGLSTTLGFFGGEILNNPLFQGFEKFEIEILLFSGLILMIAFILKFRAKKLDCCDKQGKIFCGVNEKINNVLLKISSVLYLFSLGTLAISQII